jgi:hypothetical protein
MADWMRRLPAAVLLLVAGCTPVVVAPPHAAFNAAPARPTIDQELRSDPRAFFTGVARARGLAPRAEVPVMLDDERAFWSAFQERARRAAPPVDVDTRPFYLAFDFRSQSAPSTTSSTASVLDEQLVGFYDPFARMAHVRATKMSSTKSDDEMRFIVAHELGHALQDQTFGLPRPSGRGVDDAQLAYNAVVEGDASIAALGYLASTHRKPLRRLLTRASDFIREGTWAREIATDARSAALRSAPADERERLAFPYTSGFTFMSDLYRTGGFDLMNRAFASPPVSTEQVLHPEKYLSGEGPIPVKVPAVPRGWRPLNAGHMGELLTGAVLRQCGAGADAAAGWGGDTYALVERDGSSLALLWSTVWDDENAARAFEDGLGKVVTCWGTSMKQFGAYHISPATVIKRDGARVAFVRGLDEKAAEQAARGLLTLPEARPAAVPPFGPIHVVPAKPKRSATKGLFVGPSYVNDWLGLSVPIPPEFSRRVGTEGSSLSISRPAPSFALGYLAVSDDLVSAESYLHDDSEFLTAFRADAPNLQLVFAGARSLTFPIGPGVERTWTVPYRPAGVRLITIPICNNNGAYIVAQAWSDLEAYQRLDEWLSFMRRTSADPPVCDEVDP